MLTNMPSIRPDSAWITSRWDIRPDDSALSVTTAVIDFFQISETMAARVEPNLPFAQKVNR
ncbi:hypothetical protein GCM10010112_04900 [Actinoplanes lobatus]|uniref:Uncharacterized protein n=1 Tax=Actinoplanes lobatus TaxID=113568 RepID=A0ABQ4AL55_9ACTN|nr:hypothetical protein GCM10010112_04900 [Actinoplanes lobatus]GIE41732.1 hypothetical protein Alo02nite_46300 [Actinoplanes lobatus]